MASFKLKWYVIGKLSGLWLSISLGSVVSFPDLSSPLLNSKLNPVTTPSKETTALHWENISTEIYVRVVNNTTGCVTSGKAFDLVVNTLPITFEVDDILICDDDYDGIVTGFNLELRSVELRSGNETTDPNLSLIHISEPTRPY